MTGDGHSDHSSHLSETAISESSTAELQSALKLPCQVSFGLPVPQFTLGDLLGLRVGAVLSTARSEGTDVEVMLNGDPIGWAEFESAGAQTTFRFTELLN